MVAPHELRKKSFSRTMRGYSTQEVDEYVSFLIKNYVELYRQYGELEKRMRAVMAQNDELSKDTRAVRAALLDAQRAAEKIVGDARAEAKLITSSAKRSCDSILNEFHVLVEKERTKLIVMQNAVADFKERLHEEYQAQIDRIDDVTEEAEIPEFDDAELTERIITDMKADAARWAKSRSESEAPAADEAAPDPELFDAANKAEGQDIADEGEQPDEPEPSPEIAPEIEGYPLDTEIIADPPAEDDSATRTIDPVSDGMIIPEPDGAPEEGSEPQPDPEPETEPEPESEPAPEPEQEDYDDELAKLAEELAHEIPENKK